MEIILASGSPRRRELLASLGVTFQIMATDAEEEEYAPEEIVAKLPALTIGLHDHPTLRAWRKVAAVANNHPDSIIIGADTIVMIDGQVLNKPESAKHAYAMLKQLAGRIHTVYTGVTILDTHSQTILFDLIDSKVHVALLEEEAINTYINTGEPLDKAGSYGIQGLGGRLVQTVEGSYTNVVGLPLVAIHRLLLAIGVKTPIEPEEAYRRWLQAQGKEPFPCPPTLP